MAWRVEAWQLEIGVDRLFRATAAPTIKIEIVTGLIYLVVNVQAVLKVAGSSLGRVVKVTVLPARSMVHFGAEIPGVLVAVEAVALI
ncbi:MAG: hypothetical protein ACLPXW_09450 [Xanthobacteraceae bacterium]